jgi:hypothetical protein
MERFMKFNIQHLLITTLCAMALTCSLKSQNGLDNALPVRGLAIAAPSPRQLDSFLQFIQNELAPRQVNTLILRVDYSYQYASHPELRGSQALSLEQVKSLVNTCKTNHIRIIPQINLLGHQSWAGTTLNLLKVYPDFDETPWVKMPEKYSWPNPDRLYCKSYCPLHPKVHDVVFDLVNEICDAFETDAFHAGMDEVFYIGEEKCPRCSGKDKAELFAGEVKRIRDFLSQKGRKLWIWGDRLIDGKTTGIGEWEASINDTYRAVDLIPKDVIICDWHYDRADQTAVYFAMKGLQVATCPWKNPKNAVLQVQDILKFRERSTPVMKNRFAGVVQTVWSGTSPFQQEFEAAKKAGGNPKNENTAGNCFLKMYEEILKHQDPPKSAQSPATKAE